MPAVLLVEDDSQVLSTFAEILSASGFTVYGASDAQSALESLNNIEEPVCVVLDYAVEGLDPDQFLARLRIKFPKAKVILSSGYPESLIKKELDMDQVDRFLPKPFNPAELATLITALY